MYKRILFLTAATLTSMLILAGCGLTTEQVDQAVQTVESMSPSELADLSVTIEALPPEVVQAAATSAAQAGYPTISPADVNNVIATVDAARATATAVGQSAASGERVNATQSPNTAPIIRYFFASAPTQAQAKNGIRYHLNYTTENANRVEIFGNVMSNPVEGSWPVYNESDHWVLWAANDQVWVEQPLQVQADQDTGSTLNNVTVSDRNLLLTLRDPQFVDGDKLSVDVNGVRVLDQFVAQGRHVSFPVVLNSGENTVVITAQGVGVTPPLVAEVSLNNVTGGTAVQWTRGLNQNETQTFTITAP
ncbi:MAG: hypothetical protein GY796_30725 [Chloroflexi bacterium]|nr:hypothetical protein [Chloroflexota bacterium]